MNIVCISLIKDDHKMTHISVLTSDTLQPLLDDLAVVFQQADSENLLSKNIVPTRFHEADPELIIQSYETYIQEAPKAPKVSVIDKLSRHEYSLPYQIFHDLKLVAGHTISQLDVGCNEYNNIDFFFKFCTELLLREFGTLGLKVKHDTPDDETLAVLREDFQKISSSYSVTNGEVITQIHKYQEPVAPVFQSMYGNQTPPAAKTVLQPLFSGLVGKSALDIRSTVVPDPYQLAKVIGTPNVLAGDSGTIRAFGGFSSRIPPPTQPPTQVLDSFFHPNWYTIEAPKWLIYKQKTLRPPVDLTLVKNSNSSELRVCEKQSQCVSFGPQTDLRSCVLSEELKSSVWLNHLGLKKIGDIRRDYLAAKSGNIDDLEVDTPEPTNTHVEMMEKSAEPPAENSDEIIIKAGGKVGKISLENVVRYNPEAVNMLQLLKSDKKDVKTPRELQHIISVSLLKLNRMRQERYLRSGTSEPTLSEVALYRKILKLTTLLVSSEAAKPTTLSVPVAQRLPVLVNDYHGVLPAPMTGKAAPVKSGRLPGIRGPYKKRNRFL